MSANVVAVPAVGSARGEATPVMRMNAVMPIAIAPMTAKMICQAGEGIVICAEYCVAQAAFCVGDM